MFVPSFNSETDVSIQHDLIESRPLGTWSALVAGRLEVNHIPFALHRTRGELGTLLGHVSRANPIWRNFGSDVESVVAFQGDQAYISPSWYPSKHQHGKAVPTWNYIVVHARGTPTVIDDPEQLFQHLNDLTDRHERHQTLPWKVSDAPSEYLEKMMAAIVGIEIPITSLTGKWKLGQNRPHADKLGMIAGLMSCPDDHSHGLASQLEHHVESLDR